MSHSPATGSMVTHFPGQGRGCYVQTIHNKIQCLALCQSVYSSGAHHCVPMSSLVGVTKKPNQSQASQTCIKDQV